MKSLIKSLIKRTPAGKSYVKRLTDLQADRDRFAHQMEIIYRQAKLAGVRLDGDGSRFEDWSGPKERKMKLSEEGRVAAPTSILIPKIPPALNHLDSSVRDLIEYQVKAEPYWFQTVEVLPGLFSKGWSDPAKEKLPFYGLPEDLTGMRVLDIGCAEGFFTFEAERRGAREVIGIDSFPDSVRRFNIVRMARQSNASAFLMNVYDLEPKRLGTFDLVLFYGVFYHLKHPQYALERIRSICTGDMIFQTHICEEPSVKNAPWARYYPHGMMSGASQELYDATVFWLFNSQCCLAMLDHVGFTNPQIVSFDPQPFVVRTSVPQKSPGVPPDQAEAPWC